MIAYLKNFFRSDYPSQKVGAGAMGMRCDGYLRGISVRQRLRRKFPDINQLVKTLILFCS